MLDGIEVVTKLPIDLEEIYSWIAFDASLADPDVLVSNRFFCRKSDGTFKVRGVAERRQETCAFVRDLQDQAMTVLGQEADPKRLATWPPQLVDVTRVKVADLQAGTVPIEQVLITQTLSRELKEFKVNTPLAHCS